MSEAEAAAAIERALHLLGPVVGDRTGEAGAGLSQAAVESLARAHIARRIHDPNLDPAEIHAVLGISRSSLYRAFAASGGIAAANGTPTSRPFAERGTAAGSAWAAPQT